MGSLTSCLTKVAKTISRDDADAMQATAENFRREGVDPEQAGVQAIEAQLQVALDEANEFADRVNEQYGTAVKFSLEAPAAPAPAPSASAFDQATAGTQVGNVKVVGPVPVELAKTLNRWLDMLGRDTAMAETAGVPDSILLVDLPSFRRDTNSTFGEGAAGIASAYVTRPDGTRFMLIGLDIEAMREQARSALQNPAYLDGDVYITETLAHEFGHVIERTMFANLPEAEQERIIDAYMRWLASVEGVDGSKASLDRLTEVRRLLVESAKKSGTMDPGWENLSYAKGYREWSADNIARWLLSDREPASAIEQFFARVAAVLRRVFDRLTGAPRPNVEVAATMRRMVHRAALWRAGATDNFGVGTMNADAYADRMERVMAGDADTDASLNPTNVRAIDANGDAAALAKEAFDAAFARADNSDFSLTRGLVGIFQGKGPAIDKLRRAAKVTGDSAVGKRWEEMKFALMTRAQIAQSLLSGGDAEFGKLLQQLNDALDQAEQISAAARQGFEEAFELAAQLAPKARTMLQLVMHDATFLDIHPDVGFNAPENKHLTDTPLRRAQHARLSAMYQMMKEADPNTAKVYMGLRDAARELNVEILEQQIKLLEAELTAASQTVGGKELTARQKEAASAIQSQIDQLRNQATDQQRGPWFPLRRRGDYIVRVPLPDRIIRDGEDLFKTKDAAEKVAERARAQNPKSTVRVAPFRDDDNNVLGYDIRVSRKGVFFFDSIAAAEASVADMKATVRQLWADEGVSDSAISEYLEGIDESSWNAKKVSDAFYDEKEVPASILKQLRELSGKEGGVPPSVVKALETLALEADARFTLNASALPRRNIIGASHDMLTAMAEWAYGASYTLGTLRTKDKSERAWSAMNKMANDTSNTRQASTRRTVFNAIYQNEKLTQDRRAINTGNAIENFLSKISNLMSLAFSPAYVAINATQPLVVAAPLLGSQVIRRADGTYETLGLVRANQLLLDAMKGNGGSPLNGLWSATTNGAKEFIQHLRSFVDRQGDARYTPEQMFDEVLNTYARTPTEKALLRTLRDMGALDFGHLAALQDTLASGRWEQKFNTMNRMGMAFAQHVETMNRTVTALAAYRAATTELGMEPVIALDGEAVSLDAENETVRFVKDFVNESMINYSMVNRPNVFKYRFAGPLLQFKMYMQGIYAIFLRHSFMAFSSDPAKKKQGRAALLHLLTTHTVMSGALGLGPMALAAKVTLWALVATGIAGDEEDKYKDSDTLLHEFIKEHFGDGVMGTAAERGLPAALLNMDLSSRAGIPNLFDTRFIQIRDEDNPKERVDKTFLYALGPVYSNIARGLGHGTAAFGESINYLQGESDGDDVLRELMRASPAGVRSLLDAIKYETTGVTEADGDRMLKPEDLSTWDTFTRALGVTPTTVSQLYDQRTREYSTTANITNQREDVLRAYTKAKTSGTVDDVLRARNRIRDFNRTAPDAFKIRPDQASRAVSSREEREAGVVNRQREAIRNEVLE